MSSKREPILPFVIYDLSDPPCVRPDHLYLGTNADNMRDKMVRGRWRGNPNPPTPHPYSEEQRAKTTAVGATVMGLLAAGRDG